MNRHIDAHDEAISTRPVNMSETVGPSLTNTCRMLSRPTSHRQWCTGWQRRVKQLLSIRSQQQDMGPWLLPCPNHLSLTAESVQVVSRQSIGQREDLKDGHARAEFAFHCQRDAARGFQHPVL